MGFAAGSSNLYRYVRNAPLLFRDSNGFDRYITYWPWGGVHVSFAVDIWVRNPDGTWRKVGQRTFDFYPDPTAYCCLNLLLASLYGKGKVESRPGLHVGPRPIVFESWPEEDIALLRYLEDQVNNPSFFSGAAHNCLFWSVNAINVGIIAYRLANGTLAWQETTSRSAAGAQCSNVDTEINNLERPRPSDQESLNELPAGPLMCGQFARLQ